MCWPGFSVHRHLDTWWGGGWPKAGRGHWHQHPLSHTARSVASAHLQVHEGWYFAATFWPNVFMLSDYLVSVWKSPPLSDHCNRPLREHQCSGQDPTRLLLRPHLHPSVGEWPQADKQSSPKRERGSLSARRGPALNHDGCPTRGHSVQVQLRWVIASEVASLAFNHASVNATWIQLLQALGYPL